MVTIMPNFTLKTVPLSSLKDENYHVISVEPEGPVVLVVDSGPQSHRVALLLLSYFQSTQV